MSVLMPVLVLGTGCTSLPPQPMRAHSQALPAKDSSALAHLATMSLAGSGLPSGLTLLPVASAALRTRIALIERAEQSIDLQTFIFDGDGTGRLLAARLIQAAARGVRVRLLVDDLHTSGQDSFLADLNAHPGIEVRLFNPFMGVRNSMAARLLSAVGDIDRVNRRMHNKLFLADGALAIVGSRNVADAYFMAGAQYNFIDLDLLLSGAVVPELASVFDGYWNSRQSWPLASIAAPEAEAAVLQARAAAWMAQVRQPPPDDTVPARLKRYVQTESEIAAGRLNMLPVKLVARADPVSKTDNMPRPPASTATATLSGSWDLVEEVIANARERVWILSPYLVPGADGLQTLSALTARGVQVSLLTNSLAATDEPLVHVGYSRYRKRLLLAGAALYELSPTLSRQRGRLGRFGRTAGALHAKVAVVDGRRMLVGSVNFDPRSRHLNTELVLLIDSAALVAEFDALVDFVSSSWRVELHPQSGRLRWRNEPVDGDSTTAQELEDEPEGSWWRRLQLLLLGPLVPEAWL